MLYKVPKRWIVAIVILLSGFIIYLAHWQYFRSREISLRNNSEKQLLLTQQIAQNIEHYLSDRQKELRVLASYSLINKFRGRICEKEYQMIRDRLAGQRKIYFIDWEGAISPIEDGHTPDLAPQVAKKIIAITAKLFSVSAPDSGLLVIKNPVPQNNKLILYQAIYDPRGKKQDLLLEVLELQQDLALIISGQLRAGTHTYVLDQNGELFYHSQHPEMVYRSILSGDAVCLECHINFTAEQHILETEQGWLTKTDINDIPKLASFYPLQVLGRQWKLVIDSPLEESMQTSRQQFWAFFLLSFLMIVVVSGGGYVVTSLNTQVTLQQNENALQAERLQHAADVAEAEEKYRTLIEQSPNSIIVYKDGKVIFTNSSFSNLFGYKAEEILGGNFDYNRLTTPEDMDNLRTCIQDLVKRRRPIGSIPFTGITKDGRQLELNLIIGRITLQNELAYNIVLHDVTEQKVLEREQQRQQNLATIGTMATRIAHEIKNPLASIQTGIRLVETLLPDDQDNKAYFQNLVGEVQRVDQIVKSMLTLARDEKLQKTNFDLSALVHNVVDMVRMTIEDKEINIITPFVAGIHIFGDAAKIEQVFWNLLLNAVEALGQRGTISINLEKEKTRTCITIADDGPGIEAANLDKVLEPFFSTKSRGNGLGLAISHKIIQAHNGNLKIDSPESGGTLIRICMPEA